MKYPNYVKIHFSNEEWYAKLKDNEYVSSGLVYNCNGKDSCYLVDECESYPITELKECGLKFEEITKDEYIEKVKDQIKQSIDTNIEKLYEEIKDLNEEIKDLKNKKEEILSEVKA